MNLIPDIVESLGLEIGEKFYIRDTVDNGILSTNGVKIAFDFSDKGLRSPVCTNDSLILMYLLNGRYEVVWKKKPFKPKKGDTYWYVAACNGVNKYTWNDDVIDFFYYKSGNCFRTEGEALKNSVRMYMELKDEYYREEQNGINHNP